MSLYDLEHLPKKVTDISGIKDVLLAIDPELQILRTDLSQVVKDLYIKTAINTIERWENDFSIKHDMSLTLAERRQQILDKLNTKSVLTKENLNRIIRMNITNPQFYIINDAANFYFKILIQDSDKTNLENSINKIKPAYLLFDIATIEYQRNCGNATFNCGVNPV